MTVFLFIKPSKNEKIKFTATADHGAVVGVKLSGIPIRKKPGRCRRPGWHTALLCEW